MKGEQSESESEDEERLENGIDMGLYISKIDTSDKTEENLEILTEVNLEQDKIGTDNNEIIDIETLDAETADGVETVEDALQFCLDSHRASGWEYWEAMGVQYDDGTIKWQPSQL